MDGVELAVNAIINDNISIYASGATVNSEIMKNSVRPDSVGNQVPYQLTGPLMVVFH
ncbi:MAG: hypothetical protein Ct9H300mP6_06600 [Gammaproteobacteria bacterium]|nr:MAG: hypothetical protein Ct9H300mP6_06600 [Gammaproteobacteria bacterium]